MLKFTAPKLLSFEEYFSEMAKPLDKHTNKIYYHGSELNSNELSSIMKNGLKPTKVEQKNGIPDPIPGVVYLTSNPAYAYMHATYKGRGKELAVIFEISGNNLKDIYADEDEIGLLFSKLLNEKNPTGVDKEIVAVGTKFILDNYNNETLEIIKSANPINNKKLLISVGKAIHHLLSDEQHLHIIDSHENLTNASKLKINVAYVLDIEEAMTTKSFNDFKSKAKVVRA